MSWQSTITIPADIKALSLISQFIVGNAKIVQVDEKPETEGVG